MFKRTPKPLHEALAAVADAEKASEETAKRDKEVKEVAKALRTIRNHNHFGERLKYTMGGK